MSISLVNSSSSWNLMGFVPWYPKKSALLLDASCDWEGVNQTITLTHNHSQG